MLIVMTELENICEELFQLGKTIIIKIIIKEQKDKIFNKNNKKEINGLDIRRNIASKFGVIKCWQARLLSSQSHLKHLSI